MLRPLHLGQVVFGPRQFQIDFRVQGLLRPSRHGGESMDRSGLRRAQRSCRPCPLPRPANVGRCRGFHHGRSAFQPKSARSLPGRCDGYRIPKPNVTARNWLNQAKRRRGLTTDSTLTGEQLANGSVVLALVVLPCEAGDPHVRIPVGGAGGCRTTRGGRRSCVGNLVGSSMKRQSTRPSGRAALGASKPGHPSLQSVSPTS